MTRKGKSNPQQKKAVKSSKRVGVESKAPPKKDYILSKRKPQKGEKGKGADEIDAKNDAEEEPNDLAQTTKSLYLSTPDLPFIKIEDPGLMSRFLYPNPVCFLTTIDTDRKKRNVMTLSWLTPANNYGGFVFCVHKTRHSAASIVSRKDFVLSVANALQIDLLLAVGKRSGSTMDKFDGSIENLSLVPLGSYSAITKNDEEDSRKKTTQNSFSMLAESDSDSDFNDEKSNDKKTKGQNKNHSIDSNIQTRPMAVSGSVAHMLCSVQSISDGADAGHHLVVATITEAYVHPSYWAKNGKCLAVVETVPSESTEAAATMESTKELKLPPVVTFLGSQQFAGFQMIGSS